MEADVKPLNEPRQTIQERKNYPRTEKQLEKYPSPHRTTLSLKSLIFKGDNQTVPVTAPCTNNIYFTAHPEETISKSMF